MICKICEEEFNHPGTNVCGNCADYLRDEEIAHTMAAEFEADNIARQQYEDAERRAYEAEEQNRNV